MSSKFDHISVSYVQKTAQKQPKIVPSNLENYKSDINETWPRYVTAEYLQYNKMRVSMNGLVGTQPKQPPEKAMKLRGT